MANMFNEDGTYNKTNWKAGDKITANKLNKIEESLEAINNNDISRHVEADTRLDALEEQASGQNEVTNERIEELNDLVLYNKDELDLAIYDINSRMTFLEEELNEEIVEVVNTAKDEMTAQMNQGKADMEAMVAEIEADLEGLHAKDEELSEQLNNFILLNNKTITESIDLPSISAGTITTIELPFKMNIRKMSIDGIVPSSTKSFRGSYEKDYQICLYVFGESNYYQSTQSYSICFAYNASNRLFGLIQNVNENSFEIKWSGSGNVSGTALIIFNIEFY
jgi:hypothetical protein